MRAALARRRDRPASFSRPASRPFIAGARAIQVEHGEQEADGDQLSGYLHR
jgi:hypothetical protein